MEVEASNGRVQAKVKVGHDVTRQTSHKHRETVHIRERFTGQDRSSVGKRALRVPSFVGSGYM